MNSYQNAIIQLRNLDFSTYPRDKVVDLIGMLGQFGLLKITLHQGMTVMRGRPESGPFIHRHQLSYKPQELNISYQRASTPHNTMFYGTVISDEEMQVRPSFFPRLVTAFEVSKLIREDIDGIQPITYSQWVVTRDIHLFAICYYQNFPIQNHYTRSLYNAFVARSQMESHEAHTKTMEVTTFLADIFAKKVMPYQPDYEYMVSALFTEISLERTKQEIDGVYYPSVQAGGGGYVAAISPYAVDSKLKLVSAGECTVYKAGKNIIVENELACVIEDDTKEFCMLPVKPADRHGMIKIKESIGLIFDDLKKI